LLPENLLAAELFGVLSTQLKVGGLGGVFGFDYAALPFIFGLFDVPPELHRDTFDRLSIMMSTALKIWQDQREAKK